jgi:aminocarboxymuconate-semialdehyde decarboxylase
MADFILETTRTALELVFNGTLSRCPNVQVILSHGGGFLPYAAMRFAELAGIFDPTAPDPQELLDGFRRFYFDTALSSGASLATLKEFAGTGRILFGTDSPYDHGTSAAFTAALDSNGNLVETERSAICNDNACRLLGR